MKEFLYTASVLEGSNKVISNTESNWSKVTPGCYVKFNDDEVLFSVVKSEEIFILKNIELLSIKQFKINEKLGILLERGDMVDISVKQYEMSTVLGINNVGVGYKVGDIVNVEGGSAIVREEDNNYEKTQFEITDVNENGGIVMFSIKNRGKYYDAPAELVELSGGSGSGGKFEVLFSQSAESKIFNRKLILVNNFDKVTTCLIDGNLPFGIKNARLSAKKWQLTLKDNYQLPTKLGVPYEVYRDFTPNLNLLIPAKNSLNTETILREDLFVIDSEIGKLRKKLEDLEKKFTKA